MSSAIFPESDLDPQLLLLISQLLSRIPQDRPSVSNILQRNYVQQKIYQIPSVTTSSQPTTLGGIRRRILSTSSPALLMDRSWDSAKKKPPIVKNLKFFTTILPIVYNKLKVMVLWAKISEHAYEMVCIVHLYICLKVFDPASPPLIFILPTMAASLFAIGSRRYVSHVD